jgi:hypothetical protein
MVLTKTTTTKVARNVAIFLYMYTKHVHVDSQYLLPWGGVSTIKPQIAFSFPFTLFQGISSSKRHLATFPIELDPRIKGKGYSELFI